MATPQKRTGAPAAPADDVSRETSDVSRETSATGPAPTIGRIVLYKLSKDDAREINRRRKRYADAPAQQWGFIAPVGNHAAAGQVFAAMVVRVFDGASPSINLQVPLDGTDTLWVTSRPQGDEEGQWSWPVRS